MKKIKIIDLLVKIAKNEDVPYKIKSSSQQKGFEYLIYDKEEQEYRYENDYNCFFQVPNHHLNDCVEIVEQKRKEQTFYPKMCIRDAFEKGTKVYTPCILCGEKVLPKEQDWISPLDFVCDGCKEAIKKIKNKE